MCVQRALAPISQSLKTIQHSAIVVASDSEAQTNLSPQFSTALGLALGFRGFRV